MRCSMRAATTISPPSPRRRANWPWPGLTSRPPTSPPSHCWPASSPPPWRGWRPVRCWCPTACWRAETAACGALLDYVELTQAGKLPALAPPRRERADGTMEIDPATRRNLELVRGLDGRRDGSLLAIIDRTLTGPGARLLAERIAAPLTERV